MNTKSFSLTVTENTPFNTNMFLFAAEGGDNLSFDVQLSLQSFGGSSESESSPIGVRIVSDEDVSGSPVSDGEFGLTLAQYIIPDGWPREPAGIGGVGPLDLQVQLNPSGPEPVPARGRNLYLRLEEPETLPDPNAEYSISLQLTVTKD